MKRKLICITVCLVVVINLCGFTFSSKHTEIVDQTGALIAYEYIWNSFPKDERGLPIYPDEYGGEFIDGDVLYIYLTDISADVQEKYLDICKHSDKVEFLKAKYSLNYLENKVSEVHMYVDEYNISSYCVDRANNNILITVQPSDGVRGVDSTETRIKNLNEILNDNIFKIENMSYLDVDTTIRGGSVAYTESGESFTVGICGTYQGQPAILTAGHCVGNLDGDGTLESSTIRLVSNSTAYVADVVTACWKFENEGLGDYAVAIIRNPNSVTTTNQIHVSASSYVSINGTAYSGHTPVGTYIYRYGKETGHSIAVVRQLNTNVTVQEWGHASVIVKGLVQCRVLEDEAVSTGGDSGGPVYVTMDNQVKLVGTLSGHTESEDIYGQVTSYINYSPIYYPEYYGFVVKTT